MGKRILFIDPVSGASGDMFLGALSSLICQLEPGFDPAAVTSRIAVDEVELSVKHDRRGGIAGYAVSVHSHEHHPHRGLPEVLKIIDESDVSADVKKQAARSFVKLAEAEARVHGVGVEEIHFHEVGAVDAIVDVVGTMLLFEKLGWPEVWSSPPNVGSGVVECAHGLLPVPAPAVAELLAGYEVRSLGSPVERTTPTGAALLSALVDAERIASQPQGKIIACGVGLGGRDTPGLPNVLRATLIEQASEGERISPRLESDAPTLLETNIDDMNPQDLPIVLQKLLDEGALDAWTETVGMKKGRLGLKLSCLAGDGDEERLALLMMKETTTLGVRMLPLRRLILKREAEVREIGGMSVRFKNALLDGAVLRRVPEYDDVAAFASLCGISLHEARAIIMAS